MTGPFTLSLVRPKLNSVNGFVRPPLSVHRPPRRSVLPEAKIHIALATGFGL